MTERTMNRPDQANPLLRDPGDFSFVLGGPLFQLFRKAHLTGDALELAQRRILVLAGLAWVPLLLLSLLEGRAFGPASTAPFLLDIDAQVRFLLFIPLLVSAELGVHGRVRLVARQFLERELLAPEDRPRFDAAIASTYRLRNSLPIELGLLVFVYTVGVMVIWRQFMSLESASWYAVPGPEGYRLSLAGRWYAFVSLPIAQFLLLRWYFRIFLWTRFLHQVSRINLRLVPTHPDRVGGLGFLSLTAFAFTPLAVAHGALVSAWIANRLFMQQGALLDYKVEIIAVVVLVLLLVFGPLLQFSPQLSRAWRRGEYDYGPLAERYAHEFEAKWVRPEHEPAEPLLGNQDIRSLADMGRVYGAARAMSFSLFTRETIIQVLAATLVPLAPLVLFMIPLGELVKRVAAMLF
jgi:hypothetical protein